MYFVQGTLSCLALTLIALNSRFMWPIVKDSRREQKSPKPTKDEAYVFLLYDRGGAADYRCMCMVAIKSLREYDTETQITVIRYEQTRRLPLSAIIAEDHPVGRPLNQGMYQWMYTFLKLQIARLPYKRVLFFDSDVIFYNSPVELFQHIPPNSLAAPTAYWLKSLPLMSGGPLGVLPQPTLFADALDAKLTVKYDGEMDYLIERFNNTFKVFPVGTCVLVGEYAPDDAAFRMLDIPVERALTVHFVAHWKPSQSVSSQMLRRYAPDMTIHQIYKRWSRLASGVCHD
jgi:hypothetical protein